MRSARTVVCLVAVGALALAGCSSGGASGSGGTLVNGKTFTMSVATDPGNLDPMTTTLSVTRSVDRFLYSRLVEVQNDGSVEAGLAQQWHADTRTASFTLRRGLRCADGTPLTARDVAANIDYLGDPAHKSPLTGLWVMPGTTATASARTVTVHSGAPDPFLLLNVGTVGIVCHGGLTNPKLLAKGGAGTGMFRVSEVVPNDHYTLTRRTDFTWGPGDWNPKQRGLPDRVVIKVIGNETTATNLMLSGQLNAASVNGPDQDRLTAQKLFHADSLTPVGQLFFNQAGGRPTRAEAVRRALTQALDLPRVGKVLTDSRGQAATGLVTVAPDPCRANTVRGTVPGFDLAAARSALTAAGWTPGADGIRTRGGQRLALTVLYQTGIGPTAAAAAELAQQSWKKLGVDVRLKAVDSTGLSEVLFSTGDWDVSMSPITTGLPSTVVPFVSGAVPPKGTNFAHIDNADYTRHVQQAMGKVGKQGCGDWAAAERALYRHVDVVSYVDNAIPTYGKDARFVVSDGIDPASIRMYEQ